MALPAASPASTGTLALPMKSKSCLRQVALLVIVAGIAIGAVVYIAITQKPSNTIASKCNGANADGMYSGSDDSCLSTSKDSKLELLHDVGIFPSIASIKTIRIQSGSFQMYAKYTSDDAKNALSVAMSVQMMTSSGGEDEQIINTLLQEEDSGDSSSSSLFICFTNNLAVLQMHYVDGTIDTESVYMQTEYGFVLKQNCIQYTKDKISLKSKSTSNVVDLPSSFHLEEYGAALIIVSNEKDAASSPRAYFLLGNIIYDINSQVSSYPTYDTQLIETTEEYDIMGNIIVKGVVKVQRKGKLNDNYVIVDVPLLTFQKIRMEPMPPGLRLYLTNRSNVMRVDKEDDIFVPIQEEAEDANQPPGSFSVLGTFGQEWIHSNPRVDIRDYADGYWYLWCEKFTVTLAYGSLDLKSDTNIA